MCIIGIPVHNDLECFKDMLSSLVHSTASFDKIVIIESGSTDGTKEFCDTLPNRLFEVIHTDKEGPLKAYNRLFKIAKEADSDLLITQTDVVFPYLYRRDWLAIMKEKAQQPDVGLVIPINGGGISGSSYKEGMKWVGGWCTYISKKCWKHFDGYDERYPNGWGVDIDMTYAICQHFPYIHIVNYWVDHHMQNNRKHETDPKAEEEKCEAARLFREKWKI